MDAYGNIIYGNMVTNHGGMPGLIDSDFASRFILVGSWRFHDRRIVEGHFFSSLVVMHGKKTRRFMMTVLVMLMMPREIRCRLWCC